MWNASTKEQQLYSAECLTSTPTKRAVWTKTMAAEWADSTMQRFSYLVIGGGSGGIASARRAALHGAKVALVSGCRRGALGAALIIASFLIHSSLARR
jgi:heterodisulfide reductase subunit A-like polyferredoxin